MRSFHGKLASMEAVDPWQTATRITIWISVAAWALVVAALLRGRAGKGVRRWWMLALAAYLAHVFSAFAGFYDNSHAVALAETARLTAEVTGMDTGVGLWLNYLVGLLWIIDAARWEISGTVRPPGPAARKLWWAWHVFLAFMIFNGAVIFGHGPVRWFGVAIFATLAALCPRAKLRS